MSEDAPFSRDGEQAARARNDFAARLRAMADWIEGLPVDEHLRGLLPWIARDTEAVERIKLLRHMPRTPREPGPFARRRR